MLGNYDRVAATMDAYAKGTFPPEPEVVRTPRSGLSLTHRFGLHFKAGVDPDVSPINGVEVSPRSRAQAMVNQWLSEILPDPGEVGCRVEWFDPVANQLKNDTVTQRALGLQPIDLLYIVALDGDNAMSELDDRIARYIVDPRKPRPDAPIAIRHTARLTAPLKSFFEVAPLLRHLRSLVLRRGRSRRPISPCRAKRPKSRLNSANRRPTRRQGAHRTESACSDLDAAVVNAPVDAAIDDVVALFARARSFGIQQVGWGFIYEWRRRAFSDAFARVSASSNAGTNAWRISMPG